MQDRFRGWVERKILDKSLPLPRVQLAATELPIAQELLVLFAEDFEGADYALREIEMLLKHMKRRGVIE